MKLIQRYFVIVFCLVLMSCGGDKDLNHSSQPSVNQTVGDTLEMPLVMVEKMPTYPGGSYALDQEILSKIVYPEYEKSQNIEGVVFVTFTVEKDGSTSNFKVELGAKGGTGLDAEAIRVCKQIGKFNPGMQAGKPKLVNLTIPVRFRLSENKK